MLIWVYLMCSLLRLFVSWLWRLSTLFEYEIENVEVIKIELILENEDIIQ